MSNVPLAVHVVQLLIWQGEFLLPSHGQGPPCQSQTFEKGCVFSKSEKGSDKKRPLNAQITIKLRSHCPSQLVLMKPYQHYCGQGFAPCGFIFGHLQLLVIEVESWLPSLVCDSLMKLLFYSNCGILSKTTVTAQIKPWIASHFGGQIYVRVNWFPKQNPYYNVLFSC